MIMKIMIMNKKNENSADLKNDKSVIKKLNKKRKLLNA